MHDIEKLHDRQQRKLIIEILYFNAVLLIIFIIILAIDIKLHNSKQSFAVKNETTIKK